MFVSPTGESLLVDTGNAGGRDLERIVAAVNAAGVTQIDHMWTTHYHGDHVGAMEELAKRVPIRHFYDHGPLAPNDRATPRDVPRDVRGARARAGGLPIKPGDKVRMAGLDITAVSSNAVGHQDEPARRQASPIPRARAWRRRTSAPTSIPTTDRRRGSS